MSALRGGVACRKARFKASARLMRRESRSHEAHEDFEEELATERRHGGAVEVDGRPVLQAGLHDRIGPMHERLGFWAVRASVRLRPCASRCDAVDHEPRSGSARSADSALKSFLVKAFLRGFVTPWPDRLSGRVVIFVIRRPSGQPHADV